MATRLNDGRGQVTLKGHVVDDEWEMLLQAAAKRNGQSVADFVVNVTRAAAWPSARRWPGAPWKPTSNVKSLSI